VTLAFAVFLESILHGDGFVHEELAVHGLCRSIGSLEVGVRDEAIAL
jgi:hypothetical protein